MTLSAERPLFGLVLAGGHSRRMQRDKAALAYAGQPQLTRAMTQLASLTEQCFVSVRPDQVNDPLRAQWPQIIDRENESGPLAGIRAAQAYAPHAAWWVLACDLPRLERAVLERLLIKRDPNRLATCYLSAHDGLPEPLCTLYEPASAAALERYAQNIGLAFQVVDDILDCTASSEELGKTAGKDVAVGKATYPSLVGMEESERIAADLISKAKAELEGFDPVKVRPLLGLADYIKNRKN